MLTPMAMLRRDNWPDRGNAYVDYDPKYSIPSFDGQWRLWRKSDPGTTGAYDRASVDYVVNRSVRALRVCGCVGVGGVL